MLKHVHVYACRCRNIYIYIYTFTNYSVPKMSSVFNSINKCYTIIVSAIHEKKQIWISSITSPVLGTVETLVKA